MLWEMGDVFGRDLGDDLDGWIAFSEDQLLLSGDCIIFPFEIRAFARLALMIAVSESRKRFLVACPTELEPQLNISPILYQSGWCRQTIHLVSSLRDPSKPKQSRVHPPSPYKL